MHSVIANGKTPLTPPPEADAHEAALIGICMIDPEAAAGCVGNLSVSDFRGDAERKAWTVIERLHRKGKPPEAVFLAEEAIAIGFGDTLTPAVVNNYLEAFGSTAVWPHHLKSILDASANRQAMYIARELELRVREGGGVRELLSETIDRLTEIQNRTKSGGLESFTSAELDALDCRDDYVIEGLLVRGQPGVIGGPKKACKTNISVDLTISLATGAKFLNHFYVTEPQRTALISGESGRPTIQETARRVAASKGWSLGMIENALWSFELPTISVDTELLRLRDYVEANNLQVLILDPLYLALDVADQAGNLFAMGKQLKPLSKLASDYGLTLLLNVHAKKTLATPFEPMELENIAWSGIQEWARQWFLFSRREPYDPERGGSHKLWFSVGGSAGHSGCWGLDIEEGKRGDVGGRRWELTVASAAKVRAEAIDQAESRKDERQERKQTRKEANNRRKVLEALESFPDAETKSVIAAKAGVGNVVGGLVLATLREEGVAEVVEILKNKRKEEGWRLTEAGRTEICPGGTVRPVRPGESVVGQKSPLRGIYPTDDDPTDGDDSDDLDSFVPPAEWDE